MKIDIRLRRFKNGQWVLTLDNSPDYAKNMQEGSTRYSDVVEMLTTRLKEMIKDYE